ncbi:MAG: hypothetical protein JNK81_06940 [Anaerolineales bacterium]|nr:hypothetical protein [Anaerolineales bacterium]
MAEDQGVNGDLWTEQGAILLQRLGWEKIGDSNIDIEGTDGIKHGIDSLFKYKDFARLLDEGIFVEAKRYKTTSFSPSKIGDWVIKLDHKINEISLDEGFYNTYPAMRETKTRNGLLLLWFSDAKNFPKVEESIQTALEGVNIPKGRIAKSNRLFVMTNPDILRLASVIDVVDHWNSKSGNGKLKFYYPSTFGKPVQEESTLSLEYMYSQFLVGRAEEISNGKVSQSNFVFYFGDNSVDSYEMLHAALIANKAIQNNHKLFIYQYQRDDDFRKIKPDILKIFQGEGYPDVSFEQMNILADLPNWLSNAK